MPVILIIAITWIFVVGLMALTEPSVVGGMMTFLGYCVLPLSILYYLAGSKRRRARGGRANAAPDDSFTPAYFAGDAGRSGDTDAAGRRDSGDDDLCKTVSGADSRSDGSVERGPECAADSGSDSGSDSSSDSGSDSSSNSGSDSSSDSGSSSD